MAAKKATRVRKTYVFNASPARIQKALKLLDASERSKDSCGDSQRVRSALMLYGVVERFFKNGGRFKKPYHRKPRTAKK